MIRIHRGDLELYCCNVFLALGLSQKEAEDSSQILVSADARGIASHGIARLWRYANGIKGGIMQAGIRPLVLRQTPQSLVLDAQGAMGLSLSKETMGSVIAMADNHGIGFASVRNSNHFGIAGFYSEMAARKDMIGISMTNTAALGVPTFARDAMFGTNPIAVSVPVSGDRMFTLDMATTCVTRGKIEAYELEGKSIPSGWAVNSFGVGTNDASRLLEDMLFQRGGGLLPLGGEGEDFSGYKGYGLAMLVDILTAQLSGGVFGKHVMDSQQTSARVCHFFGAIRLDLFRDVCDFKKDMGRMLDDIATSRVAQGENKVWYAGQKEHESEEESNRLGVPLSDKIVEKIKEIGKDLHVAFPED
ncbi:MAG: Ldh family oxidoreductase [Sphaerochaeta sp.]|nr:Ldh family oxidoreductase [Sphaerochaeta sp.]